MNRELLSKLYEEAFYFCAEAGPNPDGTNKAWLWEEKFAELIVRECLLAISKTKIADSEIPTMVKCHNQVEEHFGVEE